MKSFAFVFILAASAVSAPLLADEPKPVFRTQTLKKGPLTICIRANGTLEPEEVIDVGAQVSGRIVRFGADPEDKTKTVDWNTKVNEGTVLAVLDDKLYKARVNQAEASLKIADAGFISKKATLVQAEREWERTQKLRNAGAAITDTDYDQARANYETSKAAVGISEAALVLAKSQLEEANVNLGYTIIKSPTKGVIIDRRANVGQNVEASLSAPSLFLIAKDLRHMEVWVSVAEMDIGQIKKGQEATFTVDAYPDRTFKGTVQKIRLNAMMTKNVVTYTVEVGCDNSDEKLLPYMTTDVFFPIGKKKDVLLIPNEALHFRPFLHQVAAKYWESFRELQALERARLQSGKPLKDSERCVVWVETDGGLKPMSVGLGATDGKSTEVKSGELKEGIVVVVGE